MNSQQPDALDEVFEILRSLKTDRACMPSSYLYNEGWMLRLILNAASKGQLQDLIPPMGSSTRWSSEAKLYTPFYATRGNASEGFTSADGIIGDFEWRPGTQTGVQLLPNPTRFEVFEAKMSSKLSSGVTAADWYDQAVRNVACMAFTLSLTNLKPSEYRIERLAFWVVAPESQIGRGRFSSELDPGSMRAKIGMRIAQFDGEERENLDFWREEYFEPLLQQLVEQEGIKCTSWKDLIEAISDEHSRAAIWEFYVRCKETAGQETTDAEVDFPIRGHFYHIAGKPSDQRVVVCNPGKIKSRVFVQGSEKPSFPISNLKLEPVENLEPMNLKLPCRGARYSYQDQIVEVTWPGPCSSRVEFVSEPGPTTLIDNHLLTPIENNANGEVS